MDVDLHPLFRRLTGQAVWLLLEEAGLDRHHVEACMDAYHHWRECSLARLSSLLVPLVPDNPPLALQFVIAHDWQLPDDSAPQQPCAPCQALDGRIMALPILDSCIAPEALLRLPPFALGCRMSARVLREHDLTPDLDIEPVSAFTIPHQLFCPTHSLP